MPCRGISMPRCSVFHVCKIVSALPTIKCWNDVQSCLPRYCSLFKWCSHSNRSTSLKLPRFKYSERPDAIYQRHLSEKVPRSSKVASPPWALKLSNLPRVESTTRNTANIEPSRRSQHWRFTAASKSKSLMRSKQWNCMHSIQKRVIKKVGPAQISAQSPNHRDPGRVVNHPPALFKTWSSVLFLCPFSYQADSTSREWSFFFNPQSPPNAELLH